MTERTYVRNNESGYFEVMAWLDDEGQVAGVYAWSDNLPEIPGVDWLPERNPLFRYALQFDVAFDYIEKYFNQPQD